MVTYSDLFEFVIMLIAFATFIYKISKKNNRQPGMICTQNSGHIFIS